MGNQIIIVGTGGCGREVAWLIERINQTEKKFELLGFIDDGFSAGTLVDNYYVLGNINSLKEYKNQMNVCVAIGNPESRRQVVNKIMKIGSFKFPNLIDPSAVIQANTLGEGNIICAQNVFTIDYNIGNFCYINLACTFGHDVKVESFVSIYSGVNVAGNVTIGECAEIGTGSQIIQGIKIGAGTVIGAGSTVVKNLPSECTAVGSPCKPIKFHIG